MDIRYMSWYSILQAGYISHPPLAREEIDQDTSKIKDYIKKERKKDIYKHSIFLIRQIFLLWVHFIS